MPRPVRKALLFGLIVASASASAQEPSRPTPAPSIRTVIVYTGHVDARSAERFLDLISGNEDAVIGLDVTVEPSVDTDQRYYTGVDERRLNITAGDPVDAPREVIVSGSIGRTWNMWAVDGFYLIKSGGMHAAGAMSWSARPVDEATIRLNPAVRVIRRPF